MLANHVFWRLRHFYTHLLLLLQPLVQWLSIVNFNNDAKPPPKWILREFDVSRVPPRPGGLPHLETFTWQNLTPAERVTRSGRPGYRIGESPQLSCKRDQIKMRDYMDRRFTPPKRVTSPTWGSAPPCKQALSLRNRTAERRGQQNACVWQTWQAYYLRVLWWSSLKLMFSGLLQNVLFKGGWSSRKSLPNKIIVTLVTQGLPSSFLSRPVA